MSEKLSVGRGQVPVVLVLQRKLFPQDGFVTHKDAEGWHADVIQSRQRFTKATRKELMETFAEEILNAPYIEKRKVRGRKPKGTVSTTLKLSPFARQYLDRMCKVLEVDWSTMVEYLVVKANQAMMQDFILDDEAEEDIESQADDAALVETIRRQSMPELPKQKTKQQIMREFREQREAEMTEIAQTIRTDMELEEETRRFKAERVTRELTAEEAAAERRIKAES